MEIVKAFNSNNLHTNIVIKGAYNNPLFRASDIGEILEVTSIRSVIRCFDDTEKVVHSMHTLGGDQDVTFLTEKGLYKLLFKSRKPIAEKFQNWVCEVIQEIRLNGIYKLEQKHKNDLVYEKALDRQQYLLREFGSNGSIIYIIKIKSFDTGEYIVKIGESRRGIHARYTEHKTNYDEILLLDCFSVKKSKDFESFLHNHENIKYNKVTTLEGHENEKELFLIGKDLSYATLINIITSNINNFNEYNETEYEKLQHENDVLKQLINGSSTISSTISSTSLNDILQTQHLLCEKIQALEKTNKEILEKLNAMQSKTTTNFNQPLTTLGPRLQQINPETLRINKVYESVAECIKEYNYTLKRPSIHKAVSENTIYHGFRWMFVDRDTDPNTLQNIAKTKETKSQNIGYIAKLNITKTEILNVYLDRKTASKYNGYASTSALDNPVKNNTLTNGNYYMLFDKCPGNLINAFIQKNGEPLLYKDGIGQFDMHNNLIKKYVCKYDCIKKLKMSDKTLTKSIHNNIPYMNHYFKSIGSKVLWLE
jgi:prophage antirepressor-like protein